MPKPKKKKSAASKRVTRAKKKIASLLSAGTPVNLKTVTQSTVTQTARTLGHKQRGAAVKELQGRVTKQAANPNAKVR